MHERRQNRRLHRRFAGSCRIFARGESLLPVSPVRDISRGGMRVMTGSPLSVGTRSTFGVQLPDGSEPVDMVGKVVWASADAMGLAFDVTPPELTAYIASLEREATPIL